MSRISNLLILLMLFTGFDPGALRKATRVAAESSGTTVLEVGEALFKAPRGPEIPPGVSLAIIDGKPRRPKWLEERRRLECAWKVLPTVILRSSELRWSRWS